MSKRRQPTTGKGSPASHRRAEPADATVPPELTDASRGIRLQKAMAEAGVASRRDCETLITEGRVTVNGRRVTGLPAWVDPTTDRIAVDGEAIPRRRQPRTPQHGLAYYMLNKPRRVISTTDDPEGRKSVLDLLPDDVKVKHRLYPVGRLDAESTGLVLLTNDGALANRLTHPRYEAPKRYRVSLSGKLSDDDAARLREGLYLSDRDQQARRARMAQVKILGVRHDRTRGDRTQLLVTLREGRNREIRRLLARLGFKVRRLERLAIGPLELSDLARGQWRALRPAEISRLRKSVSLEHRFRR